MEVNITNFLSNQAIATFGKGIILLILIFYAIFSLLIIRQVDLMSKTLITKARGFVRSISLANAIFAVGLIILAWWIL